MPVIVLLVEGELDAVLMNAICGGTPVVQRGGPKGSLPPKTRDERRRGRGDVRYIRDRDFDFEPPSSEVTSPTVDQVWHATPERSITEPLGWRWCRHSIENYLLEPALVSAAFQWPIKEFEAQLIAAAGSIRHYQIMRFTIGTVRASLPPFKELPNCPDEVKGHEFRLPADLSENVLGNWCRQTVAQFKRMVDDHTEPSAVDQLIAQHASNLSEAAFSEPGAVLRWCSGKDLMMALAPWLSSKRCNDPGAFRMGLRNWASTHPEAVIDLLPEWKNFRTLLRA